jgi:hypothetical protein
MNYCHVILLEHSLSTGARPNGVKRAIHFEPVHHHLAAAAVPPRGERFKPKEPCRGWRIFIATRGAPLAHHAPTRINANPPGRATNRRHGNPTQLQLGRA